MNNNEKEVAIAKKLGWKFAKIEKGSCGGDVYEYVWFKPGFEPLEQTADWISSFGHIQAPMYFKDLNETHKAEKQLTEDQRIKYREILYHIIRNDPEHKGDIFVIGYANALCHADSSQRAEALYELLCANE